MQDITSGTDSKQVYDRTGVLILQVYPYYNPTEYRDNGDRIQYGGKDYYAHFFDYNDKPLSAFYWMRQETLTIFNNIWFDENGIKFYSLANVFESYYSE